MLGLGTGDGQDRGLDDVEVLPVLVQLLPVGGEQGRQAVGPRGALGVGGGDRGRGERGGDEGTGNGAGEVALEHQGNLS